MLRHHASCSFQKFYAAQDLLAMQRVLLSREAAMLRTTTSRPAPDLRNTPYSPN